MNRRTLLATAAAAGVVSAAWWLLRKSPGTDLASIDAAPGAPAAAGAGGGMGLREFGSTGMKVSEVGFGSWAIGGVAYGAVERAESLRALARAEELGCNFVDTALVYGESEEPFSDDRANRMYRRELG